MIEQFKVPDSLVELGIAVITLRGPFGVPGGFESQRDEIRGVLETVLPLHRDRVRAEVVAELETHAAKCAALADGRPAHLVEHLVNEATYFAAAAQTVAADKEIQ